MPRRRKGLIHHAFSAETLVYDLANDRALCLNAPAGLVFALCDGATTPGHMAEAVAEKLSVRDGAAVVALALDELARAELLDGWKPGRAGAQAKRLAGRARPAVWDMPAPEARTASDYARTRR